MGRPPILSDKPQALDLKDWVSEKFLQNQIIEFLNSSTEGTFWQNDSIPVPGRKRHNRYRPNGVPDILGLIDGHAIGIEVKSPNGKLLKSQIEFSQRFMRAGGSYYVIRSMEDLSEVLKINAWI